MRWLKEILEKAEVVDGHLDVEAAMKEICAEFPKHAVPKAEYNDKARKIRLADQKISELQEKLEEKEKSQQRITCVSSASGICIICR